MSILLFALSMLPAAPSLAGDGSYGACFGRVVGISDRYNPATGSGFLALRAGPKPAATQLGELFRGDRVTILARRGSWLKVDTDSQGQGWVSGNYIRSSCK
ncbi:SH3 domain-containing protein [uncultured Thiodictyon sp.]|uniref:SH3 domain-containing protein n=1 Tax=uncultured Thiodictyon sp. TaxID=1846217 RepID=UPI0025F3D1A4|nr:SH3 domain-containing protein [uncultured Thiodictyon sp.]